MATALAEYRQKRRFRETAEPAGSTRATDKGRPIFIVQLHHASHRHYDFRLQVGSVLRSWAVPKGPSFDPTVKRLAAEVEDHPLDYARFEGVIAPGQYGSGHVARFDSGVWSTNADAMAQLKKGHLQFELFGTKMKGGWHLIRTKPVGRKPLWLLTKAKDIHAGAYEADDLIADLPRPTAGASALLGKPTARSVASPKRRAAAKKSASSASKKGTRKFDWQKRASKLSGAVATKDAAGRLSPQLAKTIAAPAGGAHWVHEIKWDGYRIGAVINSGVVTLWSRNDMDWTGQLPDIVAAIQRLGLKDAVLDGELIAGQGKRDDFSSLQSTLSGERPATLSYVLFDVLRINGISLEGVALGERKALLAALLATSIPHLGFSADVPGDAADAFALAVEQGYEGIVSKRVDRPYRSGRGGDWTKTKHVDHDEYAVVGVTPPKGSRRGFGALLLARPDGANGWRYVGKVGSGFSDAQLRALSKRVGDAGSRVPSVSVLTHDTDLRAARWFKPDFVIEVGSRGIGRNGLLRQPSVKAIRLDKKAADLIDGAAKLKATASTKPTRRWKPSAAPVATVTHPHRVVFPEDGYTKQQVADYYASVMPHLLPAIVDRPLSLIRCPSGTGAACFFQKHEISGVGQVDRVRLKEGSGVNASYLVVRDAAAVMQLVQFNALEFHPWGAKADAPEDADMLVFDLDPGPGVAWADVRAAARAIHGHLASMRLASFVRTSGGKGLHVVVPLNPAVPWPRAKAFAQSFALVLAKIQPDRYVATASKARRKGVIFIDYLRNARGATSVASYSLRARAGAPVATPITWPELSRVRSASAFTIASIPKRLARMKADPWAGYDKIEQNLDHIVPTRPAPRRRR